MKQNSPYFMQTHSAPERSSRAFAEVLEKCPKCGGPRTVELNTNGKGKLIEIRRPCQRCRIAGLLRTASAK